MLIETISLEKINPAVYNPRVDLKPGDIDYEKLKKSIAEFDIVEPLIWNKMTGNLVGGHQRLKVLKELGHTEVEVSVVDLDEVKEKALNLALNKISGDWDYPKLKDLLQELDTGEFDMEITGFDEKEIEELMTQFNEPQAGLTDDDAVPDAPEPICKAGDLWVLGNHRLLCGDATVECHVAKLMEGKKAVLMATDPPYGVAYGVETGNDIKYKPIINDENDGVKLQLFLETAFAIFLPYIEKTAAWYLWHAQMTQGFFAAAAAAADILIHRQIIWVKPSLIMGHGDYHWKHELCFYGWQKGNRPPFYGDRKQTTVWEIGRENDKLHPTQKPVALFEIPINNHTKVNQICAEPFAGSGTQYIACEKLSRRCYGLEIDPHYCDVIIQRWENFTGKKAVKC